MKTLTIENMKTALVNNAEFRAAIEKMSEAALESLAAVMYNAGWRCKDYAEIVGKNAAIICAILDDYEKHGD